MDILYRRYRGESDLPYVMSLVQNELSEPYVIYTYRYFLHNWSDQILIVSAVESLTASLTLRPYLSFLVRPTLLVRCVFLFTTQACPESRDEPVGVIVFKQSLHRHVARGYIAMLSVNKSWRKRGIGS